MGSGVSTVTNGEGKITIEKANEEVLISQLKEVYKHNPDQMKRMWEQISKIENGTEALSEKNGNKDVETAKANTNSPPTMEKTENNNNNVDEMVVEKNTEVAKDNNSSSNGNENENNTKKNENTDKRIGIKIGSKITQEVLDALNKLPTEVNAETLHHNSAMEAGQCSTCFILKSRQKYH